MILTLLMPTLALTSDEVGLLIGLASAVLVAIIGAVGAGVVAFIKLHAQFRPNHGSSARDQWDRIERRLDGVQQVQQTIQETNARQDRDIAELREAMVIGSKHIVRQVASVRQDMSDE